MKIGVNSRMLLNPGTGIPHYIESLYKMILKTDKKNNYIFFQPGESNLLGNFLFDNFSISKLALAKDVDILHGPANLLPFYKIKKIKYILTIHDLSFLKFPQNDSIAFYWYYKKFVKKSIDNADIVVSDSNNTKNDIIEYYRVSPEKIQTVYLGIDDIFFNSLKYRPIIKDKYIFTISTHPKRKNTFSVLENMAKLKKLREYKLVIAGQILEKSRKEIEQKIIDLKLNDRVIIFGYARQKDLKNLYENAELFIFPSFYEGFGLPVLEAMASKCPVITSNTSSIPEIVPDKKWLVDPYNQRVIGDAMLKLLSLNSIEKNKLIEKNYRFSLRFSWRKTAENMTGIFNSF